LATAGAAGSGIVIIRTGGNVIGNSRNIYANGGSVLFAAGNDSGGGAGGTIFFDVPSTASFTGTLNVNVRGGKGGDVNFTPGCHGNGGGGGGGVVIFSVPQPPASAVSITSGGGPSSRNQDGSDCANLATPFFCTTAAGDGGQIIAGSIVLLPVELLSFTAQKQNTNQVLVAWETASEKNNAYFIVEKSTNGTTFFEVAKVLGRSNSTSLQKYNLTDYNPFVGMNYYRLKQVDIDGTVSYSKIVNVLFDELLSLSAELYPNPTNTNSFNINLSNYSGKVAIEVVDITGRSLATEITQSNTIFQVKLLNPTVSGVYLVRIATENGTITRKIVLQ
jgi:hypothetical protein